jgi:hypothetical protein
MRPQIVKFVSLVCFILHGATAFAQLAAQSSGSVPPPPQRTPPPDGPIDSGLLFLLIVASTYGVYIIARQIRLKRNP